MLYVKNICYVEATNLSVYNTVNTEVNTNLFIKNLPHNINIEVTQ